jgi:hypothetical protein
MKKIKKNESTSSKDSRRDQTNKIQRGLEIMAGILYLGNGSAIWHFHNSDGGSEDWYLPKKYLDDQKKIRDAIEEALCQLANFKIRSNCKNEYQL